MISSRRQRKATRISLAAETRSSGFSEATAGMSHQRKSARLDSQAILASLGALDRVRLLRWIELADEWDIEMPPPHIAAILEKARKKMGIEV